MQWYSAMTSLNTNSEAIPTDLRPSHRNTHTHTRLTALCPGLPRWAGTRKIKPIWILFEQETLSGSGISWAICRYAHHSRQITMPAPHHSVFYRPDALPAAQPTASKHWRHRMHSRHRKLLRALIFVVICSVFISSCERHVVCLQK